MKLNKHVLGFSATVAGLAIATVVYAAAGDKYINNTNQDKDIVLSVNDGGTQTTDSLVIDGPTSNIGIGIAAPLDPLHVNGGSATSFIKLTNSAVATSVGLELEIESDQTVNIRNELNSDMGIFTNSLERITITNTGNVGLNTPTDGPDSEFHIKTTGGLAISLESTTNAQDLDINYYNNVGATSSRINWNEGSGAWQFIPDVIGNPSLTALTINFNRIVDIGNSIRFPNGGNSELSYYESGTFAGTCSNCTAGPYTFDYNRTGNIVCLTVPGDNIVLTGTSFMIFIGVPTSIRPSQGRTFLVPLTVNGTNKIAHGFMYTTDRIDVYEEWVTNDTVFPSGASLFFGGAANQRPTFCYQI